MDKPKSLERYTVFFTKHPFLTFVPSRYQSFADGDQPHPTVNPETHGLTRDTYASLATYPVDGDFVIFGFRSVEHAQKFAKAVGSPVETIDVGAARELKRLEDVAYAVWYWRTNCRHLNREQFLAEEPRFVETFGSATTADLVIAELACRKAGGGTPMADDIIGARGGR
jgi:hypothetical protein